MTTKTKAAKAVKPEEIAKARNLFFSGLFDLSWRLAAVFLAPVFVGLWLDRGKDSPTFAIIGLVLGIIGAAFVIKKTVSEYTRKAGLDG